MEKAWIGGHGLVKRINSANFSGRSKMWFIDHNRCVCFQFQKKKKKKSVKLLSKISH